MYTQLTETIIIYNTLHKFSGPFKVTASSLNKQPVILLLRHSLVFLAYCGECSHKKFQVRKIELLYIRFKEITSASEGNLKDWNSPSPPKQWLHGLSWMRRESFGNWIYLPSVPSPPWLPSLNCLQKKITTLGGQTHLVLVPMGILHTGAITGR